MHPFQSERFLEEHGPKDLDAKSFLDFEGSEEGKEFRRIQSSENEAALTDHHAFKEKHGHTWSPEVVDAHDRIARQLKRGIIGAPDALGAFIRLHGDNHPLVKSSNHLGPQFK